MARRNAAADDTDETVDPNNDDQGLGDLGALESVSEDDVTWYVTRLADDPDAALTSGKRPRYAMKFVGKFDIQRIQDQVGGGLYRIIGRKNNSAGTIVASKVIPIDGLPKHLAAAASVPVNDTAPPTLEAIAALIDRKLEQRSPAPADPMEQALRIVHAMKELTPAATSQPQRQIDDVLEILDRGREIGKREAGVAGESDSGMSQLAQLATAILGGLRGAPPRPAPPRAATAPPGAPAAKVATAAVETVSSQSILAMFIANARGKGTEAADLADAAESVFPDEAIENMRNADATQLLAWIGPLRESYAMLQGDEAVQYVNAFLTALRNPPSSES